MDPKTWVKTEIRQWVYDYQIFSLFRSLTEKMSPRCVIILAVHEPKVVKWETKICPICIGARHIKCLQEQILVRSCSLKILRVRKSSSFGYFSPNQVESSLWTRDDLFASNDYFCCVFVQVDGRVGVGTPPSLRSCQARSCPRGTLAKWPYPLPSTKQVWSGGRPWVP